MDRSFVGEKLLRFFNLMKDCMKQIVANSSHNNCCCPCLKGPSSSNLFTSLFISSYLFKSAPQPPTLLSPFTPPSFLHSPSQLPPPPTHTHIHTHTYIQTLSISLIVSLSLSLHLYLHFSLFSSPPLHLYLSLPPYVALPPSPCLSLYLFLSLSNSYPSFPLPLILTGRHSTCRTSVVEETSTDILSSHFFSSASTFEGISPTITAHSSNCPLRQSISLSFHHSLLFHLTSLSPIFQYPICLSLPLPFHVSDSLTMDSSP